MDMFRSYDTLSSDSLDSELPSDSDTNLVSSTTRLVRSIMVFST